jgi:hypothetical protein
MPNSSDRETKVYVRFTSREKGRLENACEFLELKQSEYIRLAVMEKLDRDSVKEHGERALRELRTRQEGLFVAADNPTLRRIFRDLGWAANPIANDA